VEIVDIQNTTQLISTVGFPIACCIAMAWFIFQVFRTTTEQTQTNMEQVQARCKEREDKLYERLQENQKIIGEAVGTISKYADRLETIQNDISEIKTDITVIMSKEK
jgi:septal ring factor EnvC (AmiA/AmiB activator)